MGEGKLPEDPVICMSFVNTKLRDEFSTLEEFCAAMNVEETVLRQTLGAVGYQYDAVQNQFKSSI